MKIIKKGSLPGEQVCKCTCNNCFTVFEAQAKEGTPFYSTRDHESGFIFKCPLPGCGKKVTYCEDAEK